MKKFYTGAGDNGTTGLLGEGRVRKNDLRMETLGTLDELSAFLGYARSMSAGRLAEVIKLIQIQIYGMMAELAATSENQEKYRNIDEKSIDDLEKWISEFSNGVDSPNGFIVPGDTSLSASLSIARTVCRRGERRAVDLFDEKVFSNSNILRYLNRLSSLLFVMEVKEASKSHGRPTAAKVNH